MTNAPIHTSYKPVRKAVFPVAGLGTRFLPATKVVPKEMIPIGDRPLIQHAVEEARDAGIEEFIFITGRSKAALIQHFDVNPELAATLESRGKKELLEKVRASDMKENQLFTTRQPKPLGLGHAVWCAKTLVANEPFAVILPDVTVLSEGRGCLGQMIDVYEKVGGNLLAVNEVPREETNKYGIVATGAQDGDTFEIKAMVEKPEPKDAPSNLSITGRYILQPEIFEYLEAFERGAGNEIQLTDSMAKLIGHQPFTAVKFKGRDYDCGSRLGFIEANIAYGLADAGIAADVRKILDKYR